MIYKTESLIDAEHIINILLSNPDLQDVHGYVEAYQNGREQGLLLYAGQDNAFYICHHRNGDSPTVYHGQYAMQSISEDAYHHCHTFSTCEQAADWIASELLKAKGES